MEAQIKKAYVLLCMKGDHYGPGVIACAYSLRQTGTSNDIVCMVTDDVSQEMRAAISTVCTVKKVEYLNFPVKALITQKQEEMYGRWLSQSFTKGQCLALYNEYQKIIFIDADMIVTQNIDHLFELDAPAGTFSSPWAKEFDTAGPYSLAGYPTEHRAKVPWNQIYNNLTKSGYTFIGSLILLEPTQENYARFLVNIKNQVQKQGAYGYRCWSTHDEQSIIEAFPTDWTNIHQRYNFICHKSVWIQSGQNKTYVPHTLHYFADKKPWMHPIDKKWTSTIYNTDIIWWYLFWCWTSLHKKEFELINKSDFPLMPYLKDAKIEDFKLKISRMDYEHFPWILAYRGRFPCLFPS
jgi:lipopolysaccharide biosynthesis glycosyltransferase